MRMGVKAGAALGLIAACSLLLQECRYRSASERAIEEAARARELAVSERRLSAFSKEVLAANDTLSARLVVMKGANDQYKLRAGRLETALARMERDLPEVPRALPDGCIPWALRGVALAAALDTAKAAIEAERGRATAAEGALVASEAGRTTLAATVRLVQAHADSMAAQLEKWPKPRRDKPWGVLAQGSLSPSEIGAFAGVNYRAAALGVKGHLEDGRWIVEPEVRGTIAFRF